MLSRARRLAKTTRSQFLWRRAVRQEFTADRDRYLRLCAPPDALITPESDVRHIECQITKDYHRVEKGLALREPKRPFGKDVQLRLSRLLPALADRERDDPFVGYGREALVAVREWNETGEVDAAISPGVVQADAGRPLADPEAFFGERHSVRTFDATRPVPRDLLERATAMSLNTPSVCNRQPWKVHWYTAPDQVQTVLGLQNGNRGFRSEVPCVAVVTVDPRLFSNAGERNQRWVDGGLFAMTLVWALHAEGLVSCMLNWSVGNEQSDRLRRAGGLADAEDVIVMIAVGHPLPEYRVARSPRRSTADVAVFHDEA